MKRYPFGNLLLHVPDDHKISEIHSIHALYDRAYGFILREVARRAPDGTIVDIGANVGDTAAYMASHVGNPILSIEGGQPFLEYLRSNLRFLGPQVTLLEKFVLPSALAQRSMHYGTLSGTGSMVLAYPGAAPVAREGFIDVQGLLARARELSRDGSLALVKSDTDGLDGYIMNDAIAHAEVPLFFECDPTLVLPDVGNPWRPLFQELDARRYAIVVFDNLGRPMFVDDQRPGATLRDLCGYVSFQRSVHPVNIHYLDVWAFPESWRDVFAPVAATLRSEHLKPHGF
jgi:FkbM family methyltransferase